MKIYAIEVFGNNKEDYEDYRHWNDIYKCFKTREMAEKWLEDEDNLKSLLKDNSLDLFAESESAPFCYIFKDDDHNGPYYEVTYCEAEYDNDDNIIGWCDPDFEYSWNTFQISFKIREIEVEE